MSSRLKVFILTSSTCLVVLLLIGAVTGRSASTETPYKQLAVYSEVLHRIKSEYVEEPDMKSVTLGAINGLLEAIDPFASYLNPDQYKQYLKHQESRKAGVGLIISKKFGYVGVVDSIPGSPAARQGLSTGDMIESINNIATRDMPLAYAELLLQGEPNTTVELSVLRVRNPEPMKITLTRALLRLPSASAKLVEPGIGLLQIPVLDAGKVKESVSAIEQLQKQGAKKLILDLRNNGWGKPEDGIALANLFIEKGLLAYVAGQKVERKDYVAEPGRAIFRSLPLVVLVNRGTAAGAEVAAAALLESKRAELIGERTYGDAAIRRPVTLDDGSAVILSVAKFYSPSGKAIQDTGVTPNYLLADSEGLTDTNEEAPQPSEPREEASEDAILKRAIEILKGKQSARFWFARPAAQAA